MKCFLCDKVVENEEELIQHIKDDHDDKLAPTNTHPEGFTAEQLWYHEKNKKYNNANLGLCHVCGRPKPWDKTKNKYMYYCGSVECKEKMNQVAVNNSLNKHGVENPADVEENQLKMMEGRGSVMYALNAHEYLIVNKDNSEDPNVLKEIATTYKDASKYVYLSKVEEKTILGFLAHTTHDKIKAPMTNSNIEYYIPHDPKKHKHIPDMYETAMNLVVSCKDSILNPNMHPNMKKDRFKNIYEYQYILNNTDYNYIQIEGEEDVENLPKYIAAIKSTIQGGGRYISPPKVDLYVLMQEAAFDINPFVIDTFIINEQGFVFRNKSSENGYRLNEYGIVEIVEVEKYNNVVYDMDTITDLVYGESIEILVDDLSKIKEITERFRVMDFEEMVDLLEGYDLTVTDAMVI